MNEWINSQEHQIIWRQDFGFKVSSKRLQMQKNNPETPKLEVNSLTTEKQMIKFSSANFQKMLSPS